MFSYLLKNTIFLCVGLLAYVPVRAQAVVWQEKAVWISTQGDEDTLLRPCPVFEKNFQVGRRIQTAILWVTAHGLYEAGINSRRVGDAYFTPGWTEYDKRLQYQQYEVTGLLRKGTNNLTVTVGEGWYRGAFGGLMKKNNYGSDASVLLQLQIVYADGKEEWIVSDTSWRYSTGKIRHSDIYGGETLDMGYRAGAGKAVQVALFGRDNLVPAIAEPVRKKEYFTPVRFIQTPEGEQVIDFGQNLAGWVECILSGNKGDTVTLQHAEMLDKEGNFYTGNLRDAAAADRYILQGKGAVRVEPHFTWHGFRYVKVTGCDVHKQQFKAVALYSDLPQAGSFSCSDTLLNQLYHNIEWSLKGNFLDIPTDCPQRSERLGWTGDAQVFFRTASYISNVKLFFAKWLRDLSAAQRADGSVTNVVPNINARNPQAIKIGRAGWGDAAVIIPWTHYLVYGDTAMLQTQYSSMKAWVDYIGSMSQDHLWTVSGYGDWLAPGDSTSLPYIDQCFWAYSTQLLVKAAAVLQKTEDVTQYNLLLDSIKEAFLKHYITRDAKAITHTQTAYVLALQCNMLPDSMQAAAAERLVALIREKDYHLATGFLGTPYLLFALSDHGYTDVAYRLLLQETAPSWLYPVKRGATTIWEKWNAIQPDSTVQATSYNHYAYGAVGEWLFRTVAGIDAGTAGYRHVLIKPQPGGGLKWVKCAYRCPAGVVTVHWQMNGKEFALEAEIPEGVTATIVMPGEEGRSLQSGKYHFNKIMN